MAYTLIIDQGGHSTRAIIFDQKGNSIGQASRAMGNPLPNTKDHIEYDPYPIIDDTHSLLDELAGKTSKSILRDIQFVGCICQRSSIIAVERTTNKPVTPMISWQDTRNTEWLVQQDLDSGNFQRLTGLRPNAHAGFSKIRWLLDHDTNVQIKAQENNLLIAPWGSWFIQQLSDASNSPIKTDLILAARMGLTDLGELSWSTQLLKQFNIPLNILPDIQPSIADYGKLTINNTAIPIRLLGGDQNFITYAFGKRLQDRSVFINAGTGAFIQALTTQPDSGLLATYAGLRCDEKDILLAEGTVNSAASLLDWWHTQYAFKPSHQEINELLINESNVPIFINTLNGTGSPWWLPHSTPYFIDADKYSDNEKLVGLLESILFACYENLLAITRHNQSIENIIISGGLSRLDNFCQKLANLSQFTVIRYKDTEASARGAAFYLTKEKTYNTKPEKMWSPQIDNQLATRFKLYQVHFKELVGS